MGYGGIDQSENNLAAFTGQAGTNAAAATGAAGTALAASTGASEQSLSQYSSQVNLQGAQLQQQAADAQAGAYMQQSGYAIQYAQEQSDQEAYTISQTVGQQAEGYASGGVETMGTPLAMMNTTRAMGQLQINAIQLQGQLQSNLYETEAQNAETSGLNDILSAEGQNTEQEMQTQITSMTQDMQAQTQMLSQNLQAQTSAQSQSAQTQINEAIQNTQQVDGLMTAGLSSATSIISGYLFK